MNYKSGFTLAGVTEPPHNIRHWSKGFTLAEVLITLGIIGVVAALTIPTLINNYQKKVTLTRLKQSYSILQNAILSSQVENGDPQTWGLKSYNKDYDEDNLEALTKDTVTEVCEKFIIPYLKTSGKPGYKNLKDEGWTDYYLLSGKISTIPNAGKSYYIIPLINGSTIMAAVNGSATKLHSIIFYIDINGSQKPNIMGKDCFAIELAFTNGVLGFFAVPSGKDYVASICTDKSNAADSSMGCGGWIFLNGWEFPKDYPWK